MLGAPVRSVELTDDQLCADLETALEIFNEYTLAFVINSKWSQFYGKQISNLDIAFSLSTNTLDISRDFSDYYSHIVGLQQHGTKWELQKDFFQIVDGQQSYIIPAGRAINKVMYITPPVADPALMATYYGGMYGMGGLMAQVPYGGAGIFSGMGGMYNVWNPAWALPLADVQAMGIHMADMNKFLGNDLVYKVTAGPNGTHIIHLLSTPGGRASKLGGFGRFKNCYVWYTYYNVATEEDMNGCMKQNPDILVSPDQVQLNGQNYELLNPMAKSTVRQLLYAEASRTLALIRGKFSGDIQFISAPVKMDYNMLMTQAENEKKLALDTLKDRLEKLSPVNKVKEEAEIAENLNKIQRTKPRQIFVH